MCEACENLDIPKPRRFAAAELDALRTAERRMPGKPVEYEDWEVFGGMREGALSWSAYQRIGKALQAARPNFHCSEA